MAIAVVAYDADALVIRFVKLVGSEQRAVQRADTRLLTAPGRRSRLVDLYAQSNHSQATPVLLLSHPTVSLLAPELASLGWTVIDRASEPAGP